MPFARCDTIFPLMLSISASPEANACVTELRTCRRALQLSQAECANKLGVPLNSFRMWDSGLRPTPRNVLEGARCAAAAANQERQPLTLPGLAAELHVHIRTLQAAARTGRLEVQYLTRSVFGHPLRISTLAAGRRFLQAYYKRYGGQLAGDFAVPQPVPPDAWRRIRELRLALNLSQSDLAELVGAANKAVVYQWESRKRAPSPVFWQRLARLQPPTGTLAQCARGSGV